MNKPLTPIEAEGKSLCFDINGQTVSAKAGETIFQTAQRYGHEIPHLC